MQIELNGKPFEVEAHANVSSLLGQLGLQDRRVAVEVNREIVPRSAHAQRTLQQGDRVELVHALGGG